MNDCIFCGIVARKIPADVLKDDGTVIAIRDVNPQAPVHALVLPHEHVASVTELDAAHDGLWARMVHMAQQIAIDEGIHDTGFRLVVNAGRDGHQTVPHLHMHILGGRSMHWPPG